MIEDFCSLLAWQGQLLAENLDGTVRGPFHQPRSDDHPQPLIHHRRHDIWNRSKGKKKGILVFRSKVLEEEAPPR
jgi:hypothetical protein